MRWADAESELTTSRTYWLSTVDDRFPHLMPVWGVWRGGSLWFSSGGRSRKVRNLTADARCTAATDDPDHPVIVSGTAEIVRDLDAIASFAADVDAKYGTAYGAEFYAPDVNATVRLRPEWAFGLRQEDFTGTPTRWAF